MGVHISLKNERKKSRKKGLTGQKLDKSRENGEKPSGKERA